MLKIGLQLLKSLKICEYPDRRIKSIVYTMCTSGVRLGFWENARWKQIIPIEKNGVVVAAKLIVYPGTDEEYFTFISISAYNELMKWKAYRIQSGEIVTEESFIMRQIWKTKKGYTRGLITVPVQLKPEGIKRLVEDALWTQGIRENSKMVSDAIHFKPIMDSENGLKQDVKCLGCGYWILKFF